jgi:hypothetical protein
LRMDFDSWAFVVWMLQPESTEVKQFRFRN